MCDFISIHALREEGDAVVDFAGNKDTGFLSTPSARRATTSPALTSLFDDISIHALREEGDHLSGWRIAAAWQISIHALREEGDFT